MLLCNIKRTVNTDIEIKGKTLINPRLQERFLWELASQEQRYFLIVLEQQMFISSLFFFNENCRLASIFFFIRVPFYVRAKEIKSAKLPSLEMMAFCGSSEGTRHQENEKRQSSIWPSSQVLMTMLLRSILKKRDFFFVLRDFPDSPISKL